MTPIALIETLLATLPTSAAEKYFLDTLAEVQTEWAKNAHPEAVILSSWLVEDALRTALRRCEAGNCSVTCADGYGIKVTAYGTFTRDGESTSSSSIEYKPNAEGEWIGYHGTEDEENGEEWEEITPLSCLVEVCGAILEIWEGPLSSTLANVAWLVPA